MHSDGRISTNYGTISAHRGWEVVAELASAQHGVVALAQLVSAGISPATVRGWVAAKRLVRLHQGVFAVGHPSLRREGHYLAAVLACGPGSALSHRSAGGHLALRQSSASAIDVSAPRRTGRQKPGLRVHRGERLHADEVMVQDGVPCTTVARTLLDLASILPLRGVESTVESAERLALFDLRQVTLLLGRHSGRRGAGRLRRAIAAFDAEVVRVRSETEARFFHLCSDERLPRPLVNRLIEAGDERFEVDFHWPEPRLIVEVDSPYHDTTAARRRDTGRDATLRRHGWTVIRCRWDAIVLEPGPLVAALRERLASPTGGFR